jgi:hypothetical protein
MSGNHNTVRGRGRDRAAAQLSAIDTFFRNHGHWHDLREALNTGIQVSDARLIGKVPPMGAVTCTANHETWDFTRPNTAAPPEAWLEEWEFLLRTRD